MTSLTLTAAMLCAPTASFARAPQYHDATQISTASVVSSPSSARSLSWGLTYRGIHAGTQSRVLRLSAAERRAYHAQERSADARAWSYLRHYSEQLGIDRKTLGGAHLLAVHDVRDGVTIAQFEQRRDGIEVFGPRLSLLMNRSGELFAVSGSLHEKVSRGVALGASSKGRAFVRSGGDVLADILSQHTGRKVAAAALVAKKGADSRYSTYSWQGGRALAPVGSFLRTKPVYVPTAKGLEAAYYAEFFWVNPNNGEEIGYAVVASAKDSRVIYRRSITDFESFKYRVWAEEGGQSIPTDGPEADFTPHPTGVPDGSAPGALAPVLVEMEGFNKNPDGEADPWLPAGATESKGNNVDAYSDRDQYVDAESGSTKNDGFTEGDLRATTTAAGVFDRVYDMSKEPGDSDDQIRASVTQIFYVNNWLHDYWYNSGFDEASGVAQADNFGRGGEDGDALRAEAQDSADGGQRNNANMSTPADGASPRMQMYLWSSEDKVRELIADPKPDGFVGATGVSQWGPKEFDLTAQAILVQDGMNSETDGCEEPTNDVTGKIAVVEAGFEPGQPATCRSVERAEILQAQGAVGMIFIGNTDTAPGLGADPAITITIPGFGLGKAEGALLLEQLNAGSVDLTMRREVNAELDGTIDNQIVAHEWGHYAHHRLVQCGGPSCGGMSEGWGDYFALHMSMRESDPEDSVYGLAGFATSGRNPDSHYFGIRRYPYSTDLEKNPLTFKHIKNSEALPDDVPMQATAPENAEVHNAGEVWTALLHQAEMELHKVAGATWEESHRKMGDYLIAGMKLAPVEPSYVEQRDAILAAAAAVDNDDFEALARGFAKRGLGSCAVAPPTDSTDNEEAEESFELAGNIEFSGWTVDDSKESCDSDGWLDVDETGEIAVTITNSGSMPLTATKAKINSLSVALKLEGDVEVDVPEIKAGESHVVKFTASLISAPGDAGIVPVTITLTDENACEKELELELKSRVHADVKSQASTLDKFEVNDEVWATQQVSELTEDIWARVGEAENDQSNYLWHGLDVSGVSDASFESPVIEVSGDDDFSLKFKHAYSFEASDEGGTLVHWDGGLMEYSTDGGNTWKDVADLVDPGYGGEIGNIADSPNPLAGRQGFVAKSDGFPDLKETTVDFGDKLAGKSVQFRFRIGTDAAAGDAGWLVDDFEVIGATNTPFTLIKVDACGEDDSTTGTDSSSSGDTTDSGSSTSDGTDGTDGSTDETGDTTDESSTDDTEDDDDPGTDGGDSGCGCTSPSQNGGGALALLGFFALGWLRRRRSDKVSA